MLFSTVILFATLVVRGAMAFPSAPPADMSLVARSPATTQKVTDGVKAVVTQIQAATAALKDMKQKNPNNAQNAVAIKNMNAVINKLAPQQTNTLVRRNVLGGVLGGIISTGSGSGLAGLEPTALLGGLLTGSTSGLLAGLLGGNTDLVNSLLAGILGNLLGGLLGTVTLNVLIAQLLSGINVLNAGCLCGVDPVTALVAAIQGLVAALLALVGTVNACGCSNNSALLAKIAPLLSELTIV
ncbi:hypothetical protein C8R43DRAFT_1139285 [Mycena crocata]|nr:hypothetical protein C8R43DRAFT_1139285 [Mycena crocata]